MVWLTTLDSPRRVFDASILVLGKRATADTAPDAGPEIILQKQFRPPVNAVVIEVPAGLIDEGETPEEAAIRELREETGYVGTVDESSPAMYNGRMLYFLSACLPPSLYETPRLASLQLHHEKPPYKASSNYLIGATQTPDLQTQTSK